MRDKLLIIVGLTYAVENYMRDHITVLSRDYTVEFHLLDKNSKSFTRRPSLFRLFRYLLSFYSSMKRKDPSIVVSVGPLSGFLNSVVSCFLPYKSWHWFTGFAWSPLPVPFLAPSYFVDLTTFCLAERIYFDSSWQLKFLRSQILFRYLRTGSKTITHSSITSVSEDIKSLAGSKVFFHSGQSTALRVGFLGRLTLDKGLEEIYEVAERCLSQPDLVDCSFTICGPLDSSLCRAAAHDEPSLFPDNYSKLNNLSIQVGFISKVVFFDSIDVLFMPSKREGFGIVCIEAMSCGVPVICSDIPPFQESAPHLRTAFHCRSTTEYLSALSLLQDKSVYYRLHLNCLEASKPYTAPIFRESLYNSYFH